MEYCRLPPAAQTNYPEGNELINSESGVSMPLSEYEQRVLEQMERQLSSDDPKLANTFHSPTTQSHSGVRYVLAGIGIVVGLLMLILGVAKSQPIIGVIGFVFMFTAVVFAFARPGHRSANGPIGAVGPDGRVRPSAKARGPERDFMRRLEERWDRRRDEGH